MLPPAGQEQPSQRHQPGATPQYQPQRRKVSVGVVGHRHELDPDRADAEREQEFGAIGGSAPPGRRVARQQPVPPALPARRDSSPRSSWRATGYRAPAQRRKGAEPEPPKREYRRPSSQSGPALRLTAVTTPPMTPPISCVLRPRAARAPPARPPAAPPSGLRRRHGARSGLVHRAAPSQR
jgi:hypothetical protein